MAQNNHFLTGLLLGAAAGVAIALFLQSEKGKELMQDAREGASDLEAALQDKLQSFDTALNDILDKGKAMMDAMEDNIKKNANEQRV